MRRIFTIVFFITAFASAAFAQPNAQFTVSQLFGCAPLVVSFTDQSTGGPTSWLWQFDNGNSSNAQNPTATFATGNIYNVRLIVSNAGGSDTQTLQIRVFQPASPNFTAPDNRGCVQPCHTVHFVNQTIPGESPVTQYVWDFGDGSLPVAGFNVTNCYTQPGSYQVTLVARDSNGCQTSKIIPNYVTIAPGPTASVTASPTLSCTAPLTVNFTGTGSSPNGGVSYAWFFGNGNTSAQQNPTTTYQGGVYDPELVVSDALGCRASAFEHIEVVVMQPRFVVSSNNGCTGIPLQFTDSSNFASSWLWDFGDGTTSTLQNPEHAYANVGNYTVTLTATYRGCTGSYTQSTPVNISVPVTPTFSANDTSDCTSPFTVNFTSSAPGAVSYTWSFGDSTTSTLANPSHTYTTPGSFDVSLAVTNSSGCVNTLTYSGYIGVGGATASFSIDSQQGCSPMPVNFTSTSTSDVPITNYLWDFGDGATGGGNPVNHIYSGGIFSPTLTVTNADGCVDSFRLAAPIKVGNALIPVFRATPLIQCVNQPVNFTNQTTGWDVNTQWLWLFGDGSTSTLQNPTHAYSDTGVYDVTLVAINQGCRSDTVRIDYITIVVPKADFNFSSACNNPTTIAFRDTSQGAQTWLWDFGDGTTSTQQSPTHTFPSQNNYTITLTVTNATTGCVDSIKKTLPVGRPRAGFTVDTTSLCSGSAFKFTDTSAFVTNRLWNFGDSSTSTVANPTHIYTQPGKYTVSLVINPGDPCSDSVVKVNYITVYGVTPIPLVSPTRGCSPLTSTFRDSSTSYLGTITAWDWTVSSTDTVFHVYQQSFSSTFSKNIPIGISIRVTDSHGCTAFAGPIGISVFEPKALFTVDSVACPGELVQFHNQSVDYVSSFWNFGDGTTSTLDSPTHAYANSGNYDVTLIVSRVAGCSDTITVANVISVGAPKSDFYVTTSFAPCPPFPVQFYNSTNRTDLQWLWEFGDGDTSTAFDPLHVYFFPGDYDVTLIAYDSSGCSDTMTYIDMIRVRGPIGNFTALPDSGCVPLTVSIAGSALSTVSSTLDLGDGMVLKDTFGVTHVYNPSFADPEDVVAYFYPVYTLTDSVGCTVAYPIDTVVVGRIPYPNLPDDTTVCKGNYVGLVSQFGDHFQWTSSPSPTYLNCDTCKAVTCSAPDTVTLYVTATTNIGCVARDTVKVNVDKLPPIFPGVSFRICPNDTLQLSAGPNVAAATWTPNLFIDDTNSVNPRVYPPDSATYRVTGGNSTGCTISRVVKVYVIDRVVADINVTDTLLCQDGLVQLEVKVLQSSFNDTVIKWTPGRYLSGTTISNPVASPPPGVYDYQVIVSSSTCVADTDSVHIVIAPNPVVQAGDDQTVTGGTTIQLYASSPDNVSYNWTDVDPMTCTNCRRPFLTATKSQTVYVTVTNQYGCQNMDSVEIRVVSCDPENVYVPNTFTPNNDGLNDLLLVRGIGLRQLEYFRVFDRWGKLVYQSSNLNDGWDGRTGSGKEADVATYVYTVKGICSNGSSIEKSGNVTLIR